MKRRIFCLLLVLSLLPALYCSGAAVERSGFADVPADAWYADAVAYVRERGLMSGVSATAFGPKAVATRAMLVAILHRRAGSPTANASASFSDVPNRAYYREAVDWAVEQDILAGYGDGRFGPDAPVTREMLAALLWRAQGRPGSGSTPAFSDGRAISPYAQSAVAWAAKQGIMGGKSGSRFDPKGLATRAETAAILYRSRSAAAPEPPGETPGTDGGEEGAVQKLTIQAGGYTFSATLADNAAARALRERLPMTISMGELNGNEKFYYLATGLPTAALRPGQIRSGDFMLYGADCLVLFYESFSSGYSYTPLGRVDDPAQLAAALGGGGVEVTLLAG